MRPPSLVTSSRQEPLEPGAANVGAGLHQLHGEAAHVGPSPFKLVNEVGFGLGGDQ